MTKEPDIRLRVGSPGSATRRACRRATVTGAVGVVLVAGSLARLAYPAWMAARFVLVASATWVVVAALVARACAEGAEALPSGRLGLATALTLIRAGAISVLAGFLSMPPHPPGWRSWVPGCLYALAALSDRCDGALARRLGQVTPLGQRLDVATDALGLWVAPLLGVIWGRLPPWYLLLGGAYYLFAAALAVRRRLGWPVYLDRLRPYPLARFFAGVQMLVCAASLLPALPACVSWVGATVAMIPTLVLFIREWLYVSGRRSGPGIPAR